MGNLMSLVLALALDALVVWFFGPLALLAVPGIVVGWFVYQHGGFAAGVVTGVAVFAILVAVTAGVLMTTSQSEGQSEGSSSGPVIVLPETEQPTP